MLVTTDNAFINAQLNYEIYPFSLFVIRYSLAKPVFTAVSIRPTANFLASSFS